MTAKEYLKQIETLTVKIQQKETELACLRETAGGAAAIRYDKDNIQVSACGDMLERSVMRLVELEDKIFADKVRLASLRDQIIDQIHALDASARSLADVGIRRLALRALKGNEDRRS